MPGDHQPARGGPPSGVGLRRALHGRIGVRGGLGAIRECTHGGFRRRRATVHLRQRGRPHHRCEPQRRIRARFRSPGGRPRRVPESRWTRGHAGRTGGDRRHRSPRLPPFRRKWGIRTPGPNGIRAGRIDSDGTSVGSGWASRLFGGWESDARRACWGSGTDYPAHNAAGGTHCAHGGGSHEGHGRGRLAAERRPELVYGRQPADSGSPVVKDFWSAHAGGRAPRWKRGVFGLVCLQ